MRGYERRACVPRGFVQSALSRRETTGVIAWIAGISFQRGLLCSFGASENLVGKAGDPGDSRWTEVDLSESQQSWQELSQPSLASSRNEILPESKNPLSDERRFRSILLARNGAVASPSSKWLAAT